MKEGKPLGVWVSLAHNLVSSLAHMRLWKHWEDPNLGLTFVPAKSWRYLGPRSLQRWLWHPKWSWSLPQPN